MVDAVYKSRLLIYDAGDTRTTWVSFWKAMALLQFGTTLVFAVPPLWNNENQPDLNVRKGQAILGKDHSSLQHLNFPLPLPTALCFLFAIVVFLLFLHHMNVLLNILCSCTFLSPPNNLLCLPQAQVCIPEYLETGRSDLLITNFSTASSNHQQSAF
jgi:hypothetical protein